MTARTPIPTGQPEEPRRTDRSPSSGWHGIPLGWLAAGAILVVAIIIVGALLFVDGDGEGGAAANHSVADIVDDPSAVMGERVVVAGRIDELLTDRALTMGSDLATEDVLVLMDARAAVRGYGIATTGAPPLPAGDIYEVGNVVQFAGVVREFDREQMAEELGLVLNEDLFAAYDGQPTVVVDRLDEATSGTLGVVATAAPSPNGEPAATEPSGEGSADAPPEGATEAGSPVVTEVPATESPAE